MKKNKISILGCGWYGLPLARVLLENGYDVKGSTTSAAKRELMQKEGIKAFLIDLVPECSSYDSQFFDSDVLIISIPPKSKSPSLKDYPSKIAAMIPAIQKSSIKQVIFISSTGVYQDGNFVVNELIDPQPETETGRKILATEELLRNDPNFTTTIIRFAGLIGPDRNLAKHFAGRSNIANGLAPVNLIHLADCIGLTQVIIEQSAFGNIYHGVTPNHPTRAAFYTAACSASGLEMPAFVNELTAWKQIESSNVPEILGYQFLINDWMSYAQNSH